MKILVLQDYLRSGGTERQSVLLANGFVQHGHSCTLLTFRPGGALEGTVSAEVHRRALQPFDTRLDWFAPRLLAVLMEIAPDVVLCMGRMANCRAAAIQRRLGPRCAVLGTMRTGKPLPPAFRRSLHVVRHVVANSRDAARALAQRYAVDSAKITVIYNSLVFPAGRHRPESANALRRAHHATDQTCVLLNVAMFRPEKNQRELIELCTGLPEKLDWQLWLAGEGPARARCEQQVAELRLGTRVKFVGFAPDPSDLYTTANVAIHASTSESLSNFLIEAQAHGLPVVAYQTQGIRECFVPDRTGWAIPAGDRDAFRAALIRLASLPAPARASLAEEARAFAHNTFDASRQVAAYLELFARLLAQPRPN